MLAFAVGAAVSFLPGCAPPVGTAAGSRVAAHVVMADDLTVLQRMSQSFWDQKKARMQAELDAKLSEIDEFAAREAALAATVGELPAGGNSGGDLVQSAALQGQLEAALAENEALQRELAYMRLETEINLQKVHARYTAQLTAKPAALAPAAKPEAPAELVPQSQQKLSEMVAGMQLRELRSRLIGYGLSTAGIKTELRSRLEQAMLAERQQSKSWNPDKLAWEAK